MTGPNRIRDALVGLVTAVIEREAAFGMWFGGVGWEAGCCTDDQSFPKGAKTWDTLTDEDVANTLEGLTEYVKGLDESAD